MRHDMPEVIIDLPRNGSHLPNRGSGWKVRGAQANLSEEELFDHDGGPRKFSMSPYGKHEDSYSSKESSDRLNPLRRFLRSRVGRPWNVVHSEMNRELDNRSLVRGRHFWTHVFRLVEVNCFIATDGSIHTRGRWGVSSGVTGFYVHPTTQLLCYEESEGRGYRPNPTDFMNRLGKLGFSEFTKGGRGANDEWRNFRIVSDLVVLEKQKGGWFIHQFARHQPNDIVRWSWPDPITRSRYPVYFKDAKDCNPIYRVSSQQMGKRDLKRHRAVITGNPF